VGFCLLRSGTSLHKKQSPSWRSPATSRPRCQGRGVGVYRSEAETLDRKSGRSRRSLSAGRANADREFLYFLIYVELVFLKNPMQREMRTRLDSLPGTEASFIEPMECLVTLAKVERCWLPPEAARTKMGQPFSRSKSVPDPDSLPAFFAYASFEFRCEGFRFEHHRCFQRNGDWFSAWQAAMVTTSIIGTSTRNIRHRKPPTSRFVDQKVKAVNSCPVLSYSGILLTNRLLQVFDAPKNLVLVLMLGVST
jgi:hypothetical protein